jgi:hypothetical protein
LAWLGCAARGLPSRNPVPKQFDHDGNCYCHRWSAAGLEHLFDLLSDLGKVSHRLRGYRRTTEK